MSFLATERIRDTLRYSLVPTELQMAIILQLRNKHLHGYSIILTKEFDGLIESSIYRVVRYSGRVDTIKNFMKYTKYTKGKYVELFEAIKAAASQYHQVAHKISKPVSLLEEYYETLYIKNNWKTLTNKLPNLTPFTQSISPTLSSRLITWDED